MAHLLERRECPLRDHRNHLAGGFEDYFRELAAARGDVTKFAEISAKYSLEMNLGSVPELCRRFGLTFPAP